MLKYENKLVCWCKQCILEEDELCSRSATGLLKLQQTIWRINRSISRCSSLTEALEVVNEMKAAGIDAANEGKYTALSGVTSFGIVLETAFWFCSGLTSPIMSNFFRLLGYRSTYSLLVFRNLSGADYSM